MIQIQPIHERNRQSVVELISLHWGSPIMVTRGKIHHIDRLPGFVLVDETEKIVGLITFAVENKELEIISLDSLAENKGYGSLLVDAVKNYAKHHNINRIWLITTNDNVRAIRFYQKRGFRMSGLYLGAVNEARKIKPEIPLIGFDGIPIEHEIEFEMRPVP